MTTPDLERWRAAAQALPVSQNPLNIPNEVAFREAIRAALFCKRCQNPRKKLPGLGSLAGLSPSLADDLLSIVRAAQEAQFLMFLEEEGAAPLPPELDPWQEAREIRAELDAALTYLLGEELPEADSLRIQKIKARWAQESQKEEYSLQHFLTVYAEAAEKLLPRLSQLEDTFDVKRIEEAKALVTELDHDLEEQAGANIRQEQSRQFFYQMLALLQDKLSQIRKAAAFVFRRYPNLLQKFTSAHRRQRYASSRKEKKKSLSGG